MFSTVTGSLIILFSILAIIAVLALFLTALLTVISFSVHDTIVVFDRIRENLQRSSEPFEVVVNRSRPVLIREKKAS